MSLAHVTTEAARCQGLRDVMCEGPTVSQRLSHPLQPGCRHPTCCSPGSHSGGPRTLRHPPCLAVFPCTRLLPVHSVIRELGHCPPACPFPVSASLSSAAQVTSGSAGFRIINAEQSAQSCCEAGSVQRKSKDRGAENMKK